MATTFKSFEEIISHTRKRKEFLLIYLTYDVVLSSRVLYYIINKREQRSWRHDASGRFEMPFSDLTHYTVLKACSFFIFHGRLLNFSGIVLHE